MASYVSSNAKLALIGGALAGPMSVVAVPLVAGARLAEGEHIWTGPLELLVIAVVGLVGGVLVSVVAGFPVFLLFSRTGLRHPLLVAAWSAIIGGVAYHALFMWGSAIDWWWVFTGALAGALAGGTAAALLQRQDRKAENAL